MSLPLAISTGAGSGGQNAIGTGVVGGMLSATLFAIFFVPLFFVVILGLFKVQPGGADGTPPSDDGHDGSGKGDAPKAKTPERAHAEVGA